MKADLNISLTFRQIFDLVRQLPRQQKIRLTKELEREGINTTLSQMLQVFKTDILTQKMIDQEVEIVRQELYEQSQKH
jgi:hypothetical protein